LAVAVSSVSFNELSLRVRLFSFLADLLSGTAVHSKLCQQIKQVVRIDYAVWIEVIATHAVATIPQL
jgi:hypothetical protein